MQKGAVYYNDQLAGHLEKHGPEEYIFKYDDGYFADMATKAISLTLPIEVITTI